MRATQFPNAWPTMTAGPPPSCRVTSATSRAKSCSDKPFIGTSTAGLRPQHVETGAGNRCGQVVKIQGIATARGQENDRRPAAFGNHFDAYLVIGDNLPDALCLRRRRAQRNQTGRNARQDHTTQNDIPKSTDKLHVRKVAQPQRLGMPAQVKGLCSDQIAQRRRKI